MPKFADNKYRIEGSMWLIAILGLFFLSACSPSGNVGVDKLNGLSYSYHYRNLDSVRSFALEALSLSESAGYASGMAEAYNNLVFADIAAMDYEKAYARLDSVGLLTDNQVELLVADVQYMRLCQRESRNKDFYDYRERAVRRIKRIEEEKRRLTDRMAGRYAYAKTEFLIVCSTYYYYVGLTRQSSEAMMLVEPFGGIQADTAQYVNYLYQIGSGGILGGGADSATAQKEFERLFECYVLAKRGGLVYWQANSLQAISEHLLKGDGENRLIANNKAAMVYLNNHGMPDSLLAGYLSQCALDMFKAYGDVYQIAGAYRTLSRCYFELGDYRSSLICLENALADSAVNKAPAQVASIRECMSIVYSAMGDKNNSDINRNIYLDIQEYTRQDRQLEARAGRLERASAQLNVLIVSVLALILSAVVLLFVFRRLGRRQTARSKVAGLLSPLSEWEAGNRQSMARLDDECCDVRERLASALLVLDKYKRRSLDNKAKVFLVDNVVPYIDRMINEVRRIDAGSDSETVIKERYTYMAELAGKIGEYNAVLTHWIQLQQGQLGLHITSFNLKDVFGVVAKSATSFKLKGISLDVEPVDVVVKADKVLTLFMLNTLADNARKFTPEGGRVCISAAKAAEYVEISVSDTGCGLSADELAGIFDRKLNGGHGFGLMNCKGIVEKYKKISRIFSVCGLYAESVKGLGARFFFRLPYGVVRCLLFMFLFLGLPDVNAWGTNINADNHEYLLKAGAYADSAYFCNVRGDYLKTLEYADTSIYYLNRHYRSFRPHGTALMTLNGDGSGGPAELDWLHTGVATSYDIILDVRNESAVAALALNDWDLYAYNNMAYTSLFKERSADSGLSDYCLRMQESGTNKTIAVVVLVLLLVGIVFAFYFLYYRHVLYFRFCVEQVDKVNGILLSGIADEKKLALVEGFDTSKYPDVLRGVVDKIRSALKRSVAFNDTRRSSLEFARDELSRITYECENMYVSNNIVDNGLSALKHETMYYPARISQLMAGEDKDIKSIGELVDYYKELYSILCEQVRAQVETVTFECVPVSLHERVGVGGYVWADKVLLDYLFDVLLKECGCAGADVTVEKSDGKYLTLRLPFRGKSGGMPERDFFAPSVENIPFFVCRQIMREIAGQTNLHGCGLRIGNVDDGGMPSVFLTFARAYRTNRAVKAKQ